MACYKKKIDYNGLTESSSMTLAFIYFSWYYFDGYSL